VSTVRAALRVGVGLLLGAGLLLAACSDDTSASDAAAADQGAGQEAGQAGDGPLADGKTGDSTAGGDGAATSCNPDAGGCKGGLQCLCCGSIGPKPICLCSRACKGDDDCGLVPGQPLCNAPAGSKAGICTPFDFNCCWYCK
jgi:hypothetical protein